MKGWHRVNFSQQSVASGEHIDFEFKVALALGYSAAPAGANVYFQEDQGRTYFFSPLAAVVASLVISQHGGEECQEPDLDDLKVFTISPSR
jgi:hypothetical protein